MTCRRRRRRGFRIPPKDCDAIFLSFWRQAEESIYRSHPPPLLAVVVVVVAVVVAIVAGISNGSLWTPVCTRGGVATADGRLLQRWACNTTPSRGGSGYPGE